MFIMKMLNQMKNFILIKCRIYKINLIFIISLLMISCEDCVDVEQHTGFCSAYDNMPLGKENGSPVRIEVNPKSGTVS